MKRAKLIKIKREMAHARRNPQKASDLESLASRLGRRKIKRGKEPMWESRFEELYALAIPHHGGKDLAIGTKNSILNQLEGDVFAWEQELDDEDDENGTGTTNGSG